MESGLNAYLAGPTLSFITVSTYSSTRYPIIWVIKVPKNTKRWLDPFCGVDVCWEMKHLNKGSTRTSYFRKLISSNVKVTLFSADFEHPCTSTSYGHHRIIRSRIGKWSWINWEDRSNIRWFIHSRFIYWPGSQTTWWLVDRYTWVTFPYIRGVVGGRLMVLWVTWSRSPVANWWRCERGGTAPWLGTGGLSSWFWARAFFEYVKLYIWRRGRWSGQ